MSVHLQQGKVDSKFLGGDSIYQIGSWVFTFRGIERTGYFQVLDFLTSEHKNYRLEKELPKIEFICGGQ